MHQYFFAPWACIRGKNIAVNKGQLQFGKEGRVLPCSGVGKPLHDRPTIVIVLGDNNCYFYSKVYFLTGSADQHFAFRQSLCDHITDEKNFKYLQSHIHPEYENGKGYIENMKFLRSTWGNKVTIFTTVQLTGEKVVTFLNGWLEC